ncbi:MAG: PH domain-containing protein [Pirellulaceae bacterium]
MSDSNTETPFMSEEKAPENATEKFENAVKSVQEGKGVSDDPEKDLWEGNYSAKGMFGSLFAAGLVTIGIFVAMIFVRFLWTEAVVFWIILGGILTGWAYLLGLVSYRKLANHYELTSQRFKHRDGILIRTMNRIELLDIDDVTYTQGPVELMLNVGNIRITSSDASHPDLTLYGIDDVKTVADLIDNARRTERRRRGLHIESI